MTALDTDWHASRLFKVISDPVRDLQEINCDDLSKGQLWELADDARKCVTMLTDGVYRKFYDAWDARGGIVRDLNGY